MVLQHYFNDVVDFDVDAVLDDCGENFDRAVLLVTFVVFLLLANGLVIGVTVGGVGLKVDCLLHLEFFEESEKEEGQLELALHKQVLLLSVLGALVNQGLGHGLGLVFEDHS